MNKFYEAAKNLIKFDLDNRNDYKTEHSKTSVGFWDGVMWIPPVLVIIALALYNSWFAFLRFINPRTTSAPNPKANIIMLIIIVIGLVLTIKEKIQLFGEVNQQKKLNKQIIDKREQLLKACDIAATESGVDLYPWWHKFNGLTYKRHSDSNPALTILPRDPIITDKYGKHLAEIWDGLEEISTKDLNSLINSSILFISFSSQNFQAEAKYYLGYLYTIHAESAEFEYEEEIIDSEAQLNEYINTLDERERTRNFYSNGTYSTNEDMFLTHKKNVSDYLFDSQIRDAAIKSYKENMCGTFESHTQNRGLWYVWLMSQGEIAFDSDGNVVAVLFSKGKSCSRQHLLTSSYMPGKDCRIKETLSMDWSAARKEVVLRNLPKLKLAPIDFSIQKPQNVTDDEWGIWIYSHFVDYVIF